MNRSPQHTSIGLALGGGGARGFAHIPVLQTLDRLELRPSQIAGTSMGALMGALYASGHSGNEMRQIVDEMVVYNDEGLKQILKKRGLLRWFTLFDPQVFAKGGVLKGEKVMEFIHEVLGVDTFEQLQIPLTIVATNFYTGNQVIFDSGPLLPALRASISIPGLFTPATVDQQTLVDGACVNPVPHDLLASNDLVIAVDVSDLPQDKIEEAPSIREVLMGASEIMTRQIADARRIATPPDIFLRPEFRGIELTDFNKAGEIFHDAKPLCAQLERELARLGVDPHR